MASWEDEADQDFDFSSVKRFDDYESDENPKEKTPTINAKKTTAKQVDEWLDDPAKERERLRKLMEDSDKKTIDDLFSGCDRPEDLDFGDLTDIAPASGAISASKAVTDPYELISLKTYNECELFAINLEKIIQKSPAKSPAWLRLLDLLLKECALKMDVKDLKSLHAKVFQSIKAKEKELLSQVEKKKKPNDTRSQIKNYKDECDMMYGENADYDDEDEDDDDGLF